LEEATNDAILTGSTDDIVLKTLIDLAAYSLEQERPLFPNPLDEPILYRRFSCWVIDGLRELKKASEILESSQASVLGRQT
jgi:hypothetical protein